jgi:conjugative relaxase-like TrwC/TraI family protein
MLGVHRVGLGGADYYLSDLGTELPVPVPVRWAGRAAEDLGLTGAFDATAFRALLSGRHPATDCALRAGQATVAGYDLTFSAPKSVSLLFGLGDADVAEAVLDAQARGVAGALQYLERHALSAVRQAHSARTVVPATGACAAVFSHGVSRNADPHVHSHVVLANLVHGADGRWSSTDQRALFAHRQAASAAYDAHVRAALSEALGVQWAPTGSGAVEVVGVSAELRGLFSTRSGDIRRRSDETAARTNRGRRIAWAATRPSKAQDMDAVSLRRAWAQRVRNFGPGPVWLDEVLGRRPVPALFDEHRYAARISLTEHRGAHRRDVVAAFASSAPGGIHEDALAHAVEAWVPAQSSDAVGVAEPLHGRREVLPAPHLLCALGPRPTTRAGHDVWLGAAHAIDAYRARWGLQAAPATEALGPVDREALVLMPAGRLADHLRTARHVDLARARLGVRPPATVELGLTR